ncbi:MAG TPA: glycosyltransferase family 4 protein [Vicinamibacterales bacterium]|nr:glycosyltransferase family 4 protein [Vicinamibacterales bacterium]
MAAVRLAWFASMPPPDSGAPVDLSAAALPLLAARHDIEVFSGTAADARAWSAWAVPVRDAYDFVWRSHQRPYDLVVYQLSSEPRHDYVWGYLFHYPGLVVLQDVHFHHARARILLEGREVRLRDYEAELQFNHGIEPGVGESLAACTGIVLHVWPMRRAVLAASRCVAVHNAWLGAELAHEAPEADIAVIRPGVMDPGTHAALRQRNGARELRQRLALPPDAIVVLLFGPLTRSRRLTVAMRAVAALQDSHPDLYLLLAGAPTDECDPLKEAAAAGVLSRVRVTGAMPAAAMRDVLGAADVAVCLRWPSPADTNVPWLTCLACGLPAVITDVAHNADIPVLDPRTWAIQHSGRAADVPGPIAVTVDLLDEAETLRLALRRLCADPALREQIAHAGREWWARHHTPEAMAEDYESAIARAAARPRPRTVLPRHLRPDVFGHTRALLESMGARLPAEFDAEFPPVT